MSRDAKLEISELLNDTEKSWTPEQISAMETVVPDGSTRQFYRIVGPDDQSLMCVRPQCQTSNELAEARAFYQLGVHLWTRSIPVPKIYALQPETGMVICEDLGQTRLYDLVHDPKVSTATCEAMYEKTVRLLAEMQVKGSHGFQTTWCWDTPRYDRQLMIERESEYFLHAFCAELLCLDSGLDDARNDCFLLATKAAEAPATFFLHRDFQSRNIMITGSEPRFIDFQGGRLGPLGYDLASLLIDPYCGLTESQQQQLFAVYLDALSRSMNYDAKQFEYEYTLLALQRNLQIIGAFAFLSRVRQKQFFEQFLMTSIGSLADLLAKPCAAEYAALQKLTHICRDRLEYYI
ncbi:aminoglycoside phosphotransferase family protein [Desulfogranum japonicum]|uniref:aminoglycoside phosphotransferase family protein n=1 Tax=Desulfogranum japonicum TaxID=231447 RepID=UPI000418BA22|nr:phosphotransferase [Desulfogranum japonicum]